MNALTDISVEIDGFWFTRTVGLGYNQLKLTTCSANRSWQRVTTQHVKSWELFQCDVCTVIWALVTARTCSQCHVTGPRRTDGGSIFTHIGTWWSYTYRVTKDSYTDMTLRRSITGFMIVTRLSRTHNVINSLTYLFDLHEAFQFENSGKWSLSATGPSSAPSQIAKEIVPSSMTTPTRQSSDPNASLRGQMSKVQAFTTLTHHRSLLIVTHRLSWPSFSNSKKRSTES